MSDIAIRVEKLGKCYNIGQLVSARQAGRALANRLLHLGRNDTTDPTEFWALRDVSFELERGEVLGVIGRNGAGKSTLLKILSRITAPTEGFAEMHGRVGSLLEVGTGFHPELTGRQNVYLNGAILGMQKSSISRRFDEIVDFSGIEKFIDTPVKRYSSGMKTRLAFAVAAQFEPEILIVDEVLAVGDASFQKRAIGHMNEVVKGGRTILFVSHNIASIVNLCKRVLVLDGGKPLMFGDTDEGVERYLKIGRMGDGIANGCLSPRPVGLKKVINDIRLLDRNGQPTDRVLCGDPLTIEIHYEASDRFNDPSFGVGIDTNIGERVMLLQSNVQRGLIDKLPSEGIVQCHIPRMPLVPDHYLLTVACDANGSMIDRLENVLELYVDPTDYYGTGRLPKPSQGRLLIEADWQFSGR